MYALVLMVGTIFNITFQSDFKQVAAAATATTKKKMIKNLKCKNNRKK